MQNKVRDILLGIGTGIITYLVIKKHCTPDVSQSVGSDTSLASDLTGGGGGFGGGALPAASETGSNPNTTVISTPPSSTVNNVTNSSTGTTNTTTSGNTPNAHPIIQPSQITSGNNQIVKNPQPALSSISQAPPVSFMPKQTACFPPYISKNGQCVLPDNYSNPLNLNLPKKGITLNIPSLNCPSGYVRLPDGQCHLMVDLSPVHKKMNIGDQPASMQQLPYTMNPLSQKILTYGQPVTNRPMLYADGNVVFDFENMTDEEKNRFIGFGKLN